MFRADPAARPRTDVVHDDRDGRDGRWQIPRKVAPDRVISTVDEQARHTRKSPSSRRDGYRAHLVAEPETGLITDEALTMAAGPTTPTPQWRRGT